MPELKFDLALMKGFGTCFLIMDEKGDIFSIIPVKADEDSGELEHRAELIVRSVNNHAQLVEALENLLGGGFYCEGEGPVDIDSYHDDEDFREILKKAKQALAAAKGES